MRKPINLQMYASVTGRVFACIPLPPAFAATEEVRARTLAQPPMPTDKAQLSELMLMRYVAVDATKIWIKVQGTKVYGEKGSPSVVVSTPLANVTKAEVIHYYIAVSYKHGALALVIVSGTRGDGYVHPVYEVRKAGMHARRLACECRTKRLAHACRPHLV
jgi:hypothetical protein